MLWYWKKSIVYWFSAKINSDIGFAKILIFPMHVEHMPNIDIRLARILIFTAWYIDFSAYIQRYRYWFLLEHAYHVVNSANQTWLDPKPEHLRNKQVPLPPLYLYYHCYFVCRHTIDFILASWLVGAVGGMPRTTGPWHGLWVSGWVPRTTGPWQTSQVGTLVFGLQTKQLN